MRDEDEFTYRTYYHAFNSGLADFILKLEDFGKLFHTKDICFILNYSITHFIDVVYTGF